ncbi:MULTISPECIES: hypothetical protein [unclassified Chamaesiphon]|nr:MULTISPECIES: hypothetical protein [unclassified Chamaesiphon]
MKLGHTQQSSFHPLDDISVGWRYSERASPAQAVVDLFSRNKLP